MSKFKAPETISFSEFETIKEQVDQEVSKIMDKLAIEHNNVLSYIKDKEKILLEGNVHKYSYFLYELEENSLKKAHEHRDSLYKQHDLLYKLSVPNILLPGEYGTYDNEPKDVKLWQRAQAGIIIDMLSRSHLDRIIKSIAIYSTYKVYYSKFYDGMLAAGYNFHDKTIRKMASELASTIEQSLHDVDMVKKPDISKPIPEKYYKPSPFRRSPKEL